MILENVESRIYSCCYSRISEEISERRSILLFFFFPFFYHFRSSNVYLSIVGAISIQGVASPRVCNSYSNCSITTLFIPQLIIRAYYFINAKVKIR